MRRTYLEISIRIKSKLKMQTFNKIEEQVTAVARKTTTTTLEPEEEEHEQYNNNNNCM